MPGDAAPQGGASALWARIKAYPHEWGEFLHDVRVELKQVTWPGREDVISTTAVVIVAVAFFGIFFFAVDSTVSWLLQHALALFGRGSG
jgi:preprotein translocase subunit SecE